MVMTRSVTDGSVGSGGGWLAVNKGAASAGHHEGKGSGSSFTHDYVGKLRGLGRLSCIRLVLIKLFCWGDFPNRMTGGYK
jgi:hypothetical protein